MRIKWLLIFTLFVVIQFSLGIEGRSQGQRTKRDLAAYDKAGPYSIDFEPPWENRAKIAGEIRAFLWEHWKERRLGLVKATFFSIDGDHTSSSFFVEPDAKGCWQITVESESIVSALLPKGKKPRRETTHEDYDVIDRVEASGSGPTLIPLPRDEIRQSQMYQLRLRNSRTNSVRLF